MKLVDLLKELKWQKSTFEMCIEGRVPLSLPIVKQLVETKRIKAAHVTGLSNINTLFKLQGKSKSISAFNKADIALGPVTGKGMWTDGGVLAILSGIVLAESVWDMWTYPDESGRRWVHPAMILSKEFMHGGKQIMDFAPKKLKELKDKWDSTNELTNQEKQYFIKTYIDTAYKVLLKHKKQFQDKYFNSNRLWYEDNWNEVVLTKIKVEEVAILWHPNLPDEVVDSVKQKFKNVQVIKQSEVPSFLQKNDVHLRR